MKKNKYTKTDCLQKFLPALILLLLLCVTGCARTGCNSCPPWPLAGIKVAQELDRLPDDEFPALFEWLARVEKLRDQLK